MTRIGRIFTERIELIAGPDAEDHIKRHGVSVSDVFNVLNGLTYSRKIKIAGETRYTILGESHGRFLMVCSNRGIYSKLLSPYRL
jgi:uncharacterized DUF497 family protein